MDKLYDLKIDGISQVNGGEYMNIKINGIGTILDEVTCEEIKIDGIGKIEGNINCNTININGKFKGEGNIDAKDRVEISGLANINGNCQGNEVYIDGKVTIKGLLSADSIKMILGGRNKINEIGGSNISIIKVYKNFGNLFLGNSRLESELIEGDEVILENTICNVVRGYNVTIKGGCNIGKIEYVGEINIDQTSIVKEVEKIISIGERGNV